MRPVSIQLRRRGDLVDRGALRTLVRAILDRESARADTGIGVILAGDRLVRRLNREHRGKDCTTDVLAFAIDWPEAMDLGKHEPRLLGEVLISAPVCRAEARRQGVSPGIELARLVIHGVLHVLGYDHIRTRDRARMTPAERRYRAWARKSGAASCFQPREDR